MKNLLLSITALLTICFSSKAQIKELENNPNWKKYTTVIEKTPYGKDYWKTEYTLKDGQIDNFKTFSKEELRGTFKYVYDQHSNVSQMIVTDTDKESKTVDIETKYNSEGLKIKSQNTKYSYNQNKQIAKETSKEFEESIGKEGWSVSYQYDDKGNIARAERTSFIKNNRQIDVEEFTYDSCGNVLTIDRSSTPTRKYPLIGIGGRSLDQHETFEYEYNDDCLWTKKYLVKKGKKILLFEREIK